jgi:C4-dicarboxylate transporter, DctQ subunit
MQTRTPWWQARAEDVGVLLLTAMFLAFVLQVTSRYVFNAPLEWTQELCLTTWLWTVFWGAAFCLRDQDHIRFDMLYNVVSRRTRRVFAAVSAVAIVIAMLAALPGSWSFVSFLTIKKSASMRIPLAYVFGIYLVFMVAVIVVYGTRLVQLLRGRENLEPVEYAG